MADDAPIHDVSNVRIPFTADLKDIDQFVEILEGRLDGVAERFLAKIGAAPSTEAKTASGIPDAMPGMPSSVPQDVAAEFARAMRQAGARGAESEARGGEDNSGLLREISGKLDDIRDAILGLAGKMQGGQ